MTQPAVVNYAANPYSVELRDIDEPDLGGDDVVVRVKAVGVCGSDLHMWTGDQSWPVRYPIVLGHEFSGVVEQVGPNVHNWRRGDRVVSETHAVIDPTSPLSRVGLYNLDPSRAGFGAVVNGAMTQLVRVPTRILHRVPDELPLEQAALAEPCCVAFNATAVNSQIRPGDRILVLGPGPIGILCAAVARLCGAEVAILGLERDADRLLVAETYGCQTLVADANGLGKPGRWHGCGRSD